MNYLNKDFDFQEISDEVKKKQNKKRFQHTLGVEYTASCLAMRYHEDINKARLAGLLHDYAKNMDKDDVFKLLNKNNIFISEVEKNNPFLLHGKAGACLAQKDFAIRDDDILNAIRNHTVGRENMSMLEKIIFVADYIEPNRTEAPDLAYIRELAFQDIDKCMVKILGDTLSYLNKKKSSIDPQTTVTYKYYCNLINQKDG